MQSVRVKTTELGHYGESCVCTYLAHAGYRILARNFRTALGEIDIIATHKELPSCVVFIEVKLRASRYFGDGFDAISSRKLRTIAMVGQIWLDECWDDRQASHQIDAVSLVLDRGQYRIDHRKNVTG